MWSSPRRLSVCVVALLGLAAIWGSGEPLRAQSASSSGTGQVPRVSRVAVAPFTNLSGLTDDGWIGIGIAETVTANLRQVSDLAVVGREALAAALGHRGQAPATLEDEAVARDVARELGVTWLVAGGVQRVGDDLQITARIIDVGAGTARETVRVDGRADELFALQDRVVADLGRSLSSLSPAPAANAATTTADEQDGAASTGRGGPLGIPVMSGSEGGDAGGLATASTPSAEPPASGPEPAGRGPSGVAREVTGGIAIGEPPSAAASAAPVVGNAGALAGRVTVRPFRTQTPPAIDGRIDDEVWRDAAMITDFVQREPMDGAPASEDTDVYLAYDSANIYLAFHAKYQNPAMVRANRVDRDQADRGDDTILVYFDTFLDQQRAYVFSVNGYGVQGDAIVGSRGGGGGFGGGGGGGGGGGFGGVPRGDDSWDALFETGGRLVDDGFVAEMAIPFKSLRYPSRDADVPHTWGFQVVRRIRGKNETIVWSPVSRDVAGFLPQMGVMDGLTGLSTSRNLELQPTFTAFRFGSLDESTGRVVDSDPDPEGGVNFKYGVTSNLTADLTFNPDFSQIESDRPQVENNQRFALFFPELRPFFLEGAEIFQIGAPINTVHTRTIVDPLYGAKLTGKAGNTTLGVLYANDDAASASIEDPDAGGFGQTAQTFVGRVRYDLYTESFVGAFVTDREFLDGHSRLAGIDSNFRLGDTHTISFGAMRTDHREETDGLNDNDGLQTDGYLIDFGFRKRGRNLSYSLDAFSLSPDFKTDVGFVRRTDMRRVEGRVQYEWWPQHWVISWGPEVTFGRNYNFDDVLEDENFQVRWSADLDRNVRANFNFNDDLERYEGIDFDKRRYGVFGNMSTFNIVSFGGGFNWGDEVYFDTANPFLGRESGLRTFINFRPASRLRSEININTSRFTDPRRLFIPGVNEGDRTADGEIFNVKIFRALSTYQFTDRLLFRNITEVNTYDETLGLNFLLTYRVNSGTAFFIGYDDHYRQSRQFEDDVNITGTGYQQTNRAVFTKFQYLFRY